MGMQCGPTQSLWDVHLEDAKGSSDCSTHNCDVHVKTSNNLLHLQLNPAMQDHNRREKGLDYCGCLLKVNISLYVVYCEGRME